MNDARYLACAAAAAFALPASAEEQRSVDAHEHGHGTLNIAVEGDRIAMEFEAPGFDIVGFEHAALSDPDRATVEAALGKLAEPLELFALPDEAECRVIENQAMLLMDDSRHDDHAHDREEGHDDDHAHSHDDDHEEEGHDDHAHADESTHSEFHAEYLLECTNIGSATQIELQYFNLFRNAESLTVRVVTNQGAALLEATRENSTLDLLP